MAIVSPQANYGTAHTCFKYVSGDPISCLDIFSSSRVVVGTAAGRLLFVQLPAAGTAGDEEAIDLSEAIEEGGAYVNSASGLVVCIVANSAVEGIRGSVLTEEHDEVVTLHSCIGDLQSISWEIQVSGGAPAKMSRPIIKRFAHRQHSQVSCLNSFSLLHYHECAIVTQSRNVVFVVDIVTGAFETIENLIIPREATPACFDGSRLVCVEQADYDRILKVVVWDLMRGSEAPCSSAFLAFCLHPMEPPPWGFLLLTVDAEHMLVTVEGRSQSTIAFYSIAGFPPRPDGGLALVNAPASSPTPVHRINKAHGAQIVGISLEVISRERRGETARLATLGKDRTIKLWRSFQLDTTIHLAAEKALFENDVPYFVRIKDDFAVYNDDRGVHAVSIVRSSSSCLSGETVSIFGSQDV